MSNEAFLGIWGQRLFSAPKGVLSSPSLPLMPPGFTKAAGYDGSTGYPSPVSPTLLRPPTELLLVPEF